jgi:hypothetical protein
MGLRRAGKLFLKQRIIIIACSEASWRKKDVV